MVSVVSVVSVNVKREKERVSRVNGRQVRQIVPVVGSESEVLVEQGVSSDELVDTVSGHKGSGVFFDHQRRRQGTHRKPPTVVSTGKRANGGS